MVNIKFRRLYSVWTDIKRRCFNPKHKAYKYYGGRGIGVCNEWLHFQPFYDWCMEHGYKMNAPRGQYTIDRIDNNKGHEINNVVPCCYECNVARGNNFSFEEMKLLGKTIKLIKLKRNK